jgi:hypothetical protein
MEKRDGKQKLLEHITPNRRDFVRRILGSAAFAPPLIATFAIDSLRANAAEPPSNANVCEETDPGYVGPTTFQCHISDPNQETRANGQATFTATSPGFPPAPTPTELQSSLMLTHHTTVNSAYIVVNGQNLATVPTPNGTIGAGDITGPCNLDELLQAMAAGLATLSVVVTFDSTEYTLTGPIIPGTSVTTRGDRF